MMMLATKILLLFALKYGYILPDILPDFDSPLSFQLLIS